MPLSDTMVSGNPNLANISFIVVFAIGVLHQKTSDHFVKLSTMIKKYVPFIGPAKRLVRRDHGLSVLGYELNFMAGAFATDAQFLHDFTMFSMSLSIPSQCT